MFVMNNKFPTVRNNRYGRKRQPPKRTPKTDLPARGMRTGLVPRVFYERCDFTIAPFCLKNLDVAHGGKVKRCFGKRHRTHVFRKTSRFRVFKLKRNLRRIDKTLKERIMSMY